MILVALNALTWILLLLNPVSFIRYGKVAGRAQLAMEECL